MSHELVDKERIERNGKEEGARGIPREIPAPRVIARSFHVSGKRVTHGGTLCVPTERFCVDRLNC